MRVTDRKGIEITLGAKVIWYDPEEDARDLSRVYTVDTIFIYQYEHQVVDKVLIYYFYQILL